MISNCGEFWKWVIWRTLYLDWVKDSIIKWLKEEKIWGRSQETSFFVIFFQIRPQKRRIPENRKGLEMHINIPCFCCLRSESTFPCNRKNVFRVCIAWYKHKGGWENSRQLCKPSTFIKITSSKNYNAGKDKNFHFSHQSVSSYNINLTMAFWPIKICIWKSGDRPCSVFTTRVSLCHTAMFSYSHAGTPLGQSEWRAGYFMNMCIANRYSLSFRESAQCTECGIHRDCTNQENNFFCDSEFHTYAIIRL